MELRLDKIPSATGNAALQRTVTLGRWIPARAGTVIAVRVLDEKDRYNQLEDVGGRMMTVHRGDIIAGVLGERRALRGYTGVVPSHITTGDELHLLNLGGVIGRCTSASPDVGPPARVEVLGAVLQSSDPKMPPTVATIRHGPVPLADHLEALPPVVFVVGSCMAAGKTAAACALVREFSAQGLRVGTAKVTGVALRRDTLEMLDHGAVSAYSFVDAGLPSTCGGETASAARGCLNTLTNDGVDVAIVELGDGLLGEYGVMDLLRTPDIAACVGAVVLSASDPVAAWGGARILEGLGLPLVAVTGPATDNLAGSERIDAMLGIAAVNACRRPGALADVVLGALRSAAAPKRTTEPSYLEACA